MRTAIAKRLAPPDQDMMLVLLCWATASSTFVQLIFAVALRSVADLYVSSVLGAYTIGLILAMKLIPNDGRMDRARWFAALGLMAMCLALTRVWPGVTGLGVAPLIGFVLLLPILSGRRMWFAMAMTLLAVEATDLLQALAVFDIDHLIEQAVRSSGLAMAAFMLVVVLWRQRTEVVDALHRFGSLYEGVPIGLFRATPDGRFVEVNAALVAMLGFADRASLLRTPIAEVYPESPERHKIFAELNEHGAANVEVPAIRADGRQIWTRLNVIATCDTASRQLLYEGSAEESTAERAAREMEARLASIVETADDAIFATALDGRIISWNAGAERIYGYSAEEILGTSVFRTVPKELATEAGANLARTADGQSVRAMQTERITKDGRRVAVSISISPVHSPEGRIIGGSAIVRDMTEQHRLETELYRRTYHDALTGLPNRRLAMDTLQHGLDAVNGNGHEMGFVLLDLDAFTSTNDTYGHAVGDQVLVEVGVRIRRSARPDDLVARMGNDSFAVILTEIRSPSAALASAELMLEALREPMRIGQYQLTVSATVGVVTTAETAFVEPEEILAAAEFAVEAAPAHGSQRIVVFEGRMREQALSRVRLEEDIRVGIERNEFEPYYQPIVDVASGQVLGVEALARWRHRARGILGPDEFIPIAEESDLIVDLGTAILRRAAEEILAYGEPWHTVNVNVSAVQFAQPTFLDTVRQVLAETGLRASRLKLELTESVMMNDAVDAKAKFAELRALGVRTVMDDFGTGYSSLQYLRDLELDGIKIDRSFINGLAPGSPNHPLVEAAVAMGKALGLEVTAEGIENATQLAELRSIGCDLGQGYLFARPEPAQAMRLRLGDQAFAAAV